MPSGEVCSHVCEDGWLGGRGVGPPIGYSDLLLDAVGDVSDSAFILWVSSEVI